MSAAAELATNLGVLRYHEADYKPSLLLLRGSGPGVTGRRNYRGPVVRRGSAPEGAFELIEEGTPNISAGSRVSRSGRAVTAMTTIETPATVDSPRSSRSVLVTVAAVMEETDDARSLVFDVPADRRAEFAYKPGQFLTLRIPSDRTGSVARCYSLASSPFADEPPKVTVKRIRDGYASHWLCDNVGVGDTIEILPPSGTFTPSNLDEDLLLFAAGSGITPVISILKSALARGSGKVTLFYANRDEKSVIFARELRELTTRHSDRLSVAHWLESIQGLPTAAHLAALSTAYRDHSVYMCGPKPFMDAVHDATARSGIARNRVHAETFTSLSGDPFAEVVLTETGEDGADTATVSVSLDGVEHELRWPRTASLVDVLLSEGLNVPFSCRKGECGSCACTLRAGKVDLGNTSVLDEEDIADGYILACQARPISENLSIEF